VGSAHSWVRWFAISLSILVAASAAIEEFFRFGERWRHYRRTSEILKIEGWQFFLLNGPYRRFDTHQEAYRSFTGRVEEVLGQDIEQYFQRVIGEERQRIGPGAG